MKNLHGASAILDMLLVSGDRFNDKESAQLENMICRLVKPRQKRCTLKQWVISELRDRQKRNPGRDHWKLEAIRIVRDKQGWGLKDSKEWVEKNILEYILNGEEIIDFP